jgi:hypothetical protein
MSVASTLVPYFHEFFSAPRRSDGPLAFVIVQKGSNVGWIPLRIFRAEKHRKIDVRIIENNLAGDIGSGSDSGGSEDAGDLE